MPAQVLAVVPGRYPDDCAIVALSHYLGVPYDQVLEAAQHVIRPWRNGGLTARACQAVARRLGHTLRTQARYDPATAYGLLLTTDHAVVLRQGLVFEADATVWPWEAWLAHFAPTLERLLVEPSPPRRRRRPA